LTAVGWSSLGLGAVLTKKDENDHEYVIAFACRSNNKVESNCSSHEEEALTAVGSTYAQPLPVEDGAGGQNDASFNPKEHTG
jgi:hypothetical protein